MSETVELRVRRGGGDGVGESPRWETFSVPYTPRMRVLDALESVRERLDVDLGYRWYCGIKKCGLCAVMLNGVPALACWEPMPASASVEPLRHLPVLRDLVVSRDAYIERLTALCPLLQRQKPYCEFPEALTDIDLRPTEHLRDCIQCLVCDAACPVVALGDTGFSGPAVLVQLAELALDPRDGGPRGETAATGCRVFKCISCYRCDDVCPSEIPIVREAIEPLKHRALVEGRKGSRHARVFAGLVVRFGELKPALLVLKVRLGRAGMRNALIVGLRMLVRGKVRPAYVLRSLLPAPASQVTRLYRKVIGRMG